MSVIYTAEIKFGLTLDLQIPEMTTNSTKTRKVKLIQQYKRVLQAMSLGVILRDDANRLRIYQYTMATVWLMNINYVP